MTPRQEYDDYINHVKRGYGWVDTELLSNLSPSALIHLLDDVADGKAEVFKAQESFDDGEYIRNPNGEMTIARWKDSI